MLELARVQRTLRAIAAERTDSVAMVDRFPHFCYERNREQFDVAAWLGCRANPRYSWAVISTDGRVSYVGDPSPQ